MIPACAHFIWIGREFPWLNYAAVASAARRGGFERVVLHHSDALDHAPHFRALSAVACVECRPLAPEALLERAAGSRLVERYRLVSSPAARSNLLRLALLSSEGGVYLDLDTVCVRELDELRASADFFCGSERIAFPGKLEPLRAPFAYAAALARSGARDLMRRSARAVELFRRYEWHYPVLANNAVLGARAGTPFVRELIERALALSPRQAKRRYALGTTLLQAALAGGAPSAVRVLSPEYFYPLPPEISEHWFRRDTRARLSEVLTRETRVVHWYASVRTRDIVPVFDAALVRRGRAAGLLAELLTQVLSDER